MSGYIALFAFGICALYAIIGTILDRRKAPDSIQISCGIVAIFLVVVAIVPYHSESDLYKPDRLEKVGDVFKATIGSETYEIGSKIQYDCEDYMVRITTRKNIYGMDLLKCMDVLVPVEKKVLVE